MAGYPDWAPKKKKSANVWEREEELAAPEVQEEPKQPERPARECPTCHVPLRLWESEGFLVVYQAMSKAMPGLANVPHSSLPGLLIFILQSSLWRVRRKASSSEVNGSAASCMALSQYSSPLSK